MNVVDLESAQPLTKYVHAPAEFALLS